MVPKTSPERRRSSCSKIPVSPLSVQTRIAASSSRLNLNQIHSVPSSTSDKRSSPSRSASSEEKQTTLSNNQLQSMSEKSVLCDKEKTNKTDNNSIKPTALTTITTTQLLCKTGSNSDNISNPNLIPVITTDICITQPEEQTINIQ